MHAYPEQLATIVRRLWNKTFAGESFFNLPAYSTSEALPRPAALRSLLSICYQASLLRDEGRAVRFRLMLCNPIALARRKRTPEELHVVRFTKPRLLTADNLRRLAAAAAFEHTLVAARPRAEGRFEIWGLVHSGEKWLRALEGSRRSFPALPPSLVVNAVGPGNVTVSKGSLVVARLLGGRLVTPMPSALEVTPRDSEGEAVDAVFLAAHQQASRRHRRSWAQVNAPVISQLRRQTAMRLMSAMRRLKHGGTLVVLPMDLVRKPACWQRVLNLKYAFPPGPPRRRLFTLLLSLMEALAKDCGQRFGPRHRVTWRDYLTSSNAEVRRADEAITEHVRFVASLSLVDGAVVLGQPLELLGFGAEISGQLAPVHRVARALDSSGKRTSMESVLNVGTRHRSAYRLCWAIPGVAAAVISQDGSVRIVKRAKDRVVYSEHLGTGALDP